MIAADPVVSGGRLIARILADATTAAGHEIVAFGLDGASTVTDGFEVEARFVPGWRSEAPPQAALHLAIGRDGQTWLFSLGAGADIPTARAILRSLHAVE